MISAEHSNNNGKKLIYQRNLVAWLYFEYNLKAL